MTTAATPPAAGSSWAREFMAYIKGVPTYYLPALQRVLQAREEPYMVLKNKVSVRGRVVLSFGVAIHHTLYTPNIAYVRMYWKCSSFSRSVNTDGCSSIYMYAIEVPFGRCLFQVAIFG